MDIRQLRYFLQVCNDGSLQKASRNLFISQQALSKAISALEIEIGMPLFQRTSRGLLPNETGLLLRELAKPVTIAMDYLLEEIQNSVKLSTGQLSIGIASGLEQFVTRPMLDTFLIAHPELHVSLAEYPYDQCEQLVETGKLTAALINGPVNSQKLRFTRLLCCQRIAIVQKKSALAKKMLLHIHDLKDCTFAININNRCYQTFVSLCHKNGFDPEVYRTGDVSSMMNLCNDHGYTGLGVNFLLMRSWPSYPNLVAVPMDDKEFYYPVEFIVNSTQYHNKNVSLLIDFICKNMLNNSKVDFSYPHFF